MIARSSRVLTALALAGTLFLSPTRASLAAGPTQHDGPGKNRPAAGRSVNPGIQPSTPPDTKANDAGQGPDTIALTQEQIQASGIAVAKAGPGTLSRRLIVPGTITLDASRVARAPARVAGNVTQLRKRLGDTVAKGEIVALLDSREAADAKTEYLSASVAHDLKKTLYERAQVLWGKKVSAEQQFLQAEATYVEARLRLDLARQKLSALDLDAAEVTAEAKEDAEKKGTSRLRQFPVRSPIAGRVVETKVDLGAAVGSEGEPADLYTIADVSRLWIELSVPTGELSSIEEGQPVEIAKEGTVGLRQRGRIVFVSPMLNLETRSARVIAEIANDGGVWRAGTFVTAAVLLGEETAPVVVPRAALQTIDGQPAVFVQTATGFEKRAVKVGRQDGVGVEVLAGLSPGEPIAVENTFVLKAEFGKAAAEN